MASGQRKSGKSRPRGSAESADIDALPLSQRRKLTHSNTQQTKQDVRDVFQPSRTSHVDGRANRSLPLPTPNPSPPPPDRILLPTRGALDTSVAANLKPWGLNDPSAPWNSKLLNLPQAVRLMSFANTAPADASHLYLSGLTYRYGIGNHKVDHKKAMKFFERAAKQYKYPAACCALGDMFETGLGGVQANVTTAHKWYEMGNKASGDDRGRSLCLVRLASSNFRLHLNAEKGCKAVDTYLDLAFTCFDDALTHLSGNDDIESLLLLTVGDLVDMDAAQRKKTLLDAGLGCALFITGEKYKERAEAIDKKRESETNEASPDMKMDEAETKDSNSKDESSTIDSNFLKRVAYTYIMRAADCGNSCALNQVGYGYENGDGGLPVDNEKAAEAYKKAAEMGLAAGQFNYGCFVMKGVVAPPDPIAATGWYKKAAEQGDPDALYELGRCFETGTGVKVNHKRAVEYYQKAAAKKHVEAYVQLGICLSNGLGGVAKDPVKAVGWLQKAVNESEHPRAQVLLGQRYESGSGVPKDVRKALDLFKAAAEQNDAVAKRLYAQLNNRLNGKVRVPAGVPANTN
ncbi:hypothetical protein HK102_003643 [Quaeritorhiza haematococci]|nr:hypothetical protein HK102_003643 [Quaeritorhiza haematococci]